MPEMFVTVPNDSLARDMDLARTVGKIFVRKN
jgi:hypothetical protein